jgi:hypothetical protein
MDSGSVRSEDEDGYHLSGATGASPWTSTFQDHAEVDSIWTPAMVILGGIPRKSI